MNIISKAISQGSQSVEYVEILDLPSVYQDQSAKLRIKIKSDSYKFQSFARVEKWDGDKWREVHSIHHGIMLTPTGLSSRPRGEGLAFSHFRADRKELLRVAKGIVMPVARRAV